MNWLVRCLQLPPRRVVLWHSVAALPIASLVTVGALLSFQYHRLSDETRLSIDHGYELLDRTQRLFEGVEDAAIAARDYVITGDERTLAPFHAAEQHAAAFARQLAPLVADHADESRRVADIDGQAARQLRELATVIEARRHGGFDEARRLPTFGASSSSLVELRRKVAALTALERARLGAQQALARTHERHLVWTGAAVAGCSVLLRLAIALWMRRMRRSQAFEGAA